MRMHPERLYRFIFTAYMAVWHSPNLGKPLQAPPQKDNDEICPLADLNACLIGLSFSCLSTNQNYIKHVIVLTIACEYACCSGANHKSLTTVYEYNLISICSWFIACANTIRYILLQYSQISWLLSLCTTVVTSTWIVFV